MNQEIPVSPQPTPSQQPSALTPSEEKSKGLPKIILVVLLSLIIGGVAILYIIFQQTRESEPSLTPGGVEDQLITSTTSSQDQPSSLHYIGSQTITLRDSQGGGNSGNATRSIVSGNNFLVVNANLPDPEEGKFYQTWVALEENSPKTGRLYKVSPGTYSSVSNYAFDATNPPFKDFDSLYNTVIVSQEALDDNVMETKMLEGTFTQ
ncbi:MAG: hypothetical protein KAV87_17370 [Desulfobacteraceae bacterium]|nr:hypothetical protein [Desulfobacteraceae bacterium]